MKKIELTNKVVIFVPCTNGARVVDNKHLAELLTKQCAEKFGGANISESMGYYLMGDRTLCNEKNYNVTIYYSDADKEKMERYLDISCESLARTLNQECIGIEINGIFRMYFID